MNCDPIFKQENSIPHFKPSLEEFSDFKKFIAYIEPFGKEFGLVKITPPKEWASIVAPHASKNAPKIKIRSAIMQEFEGKLGIYRLKNKEVRKTFSVNDWFELCNSTNYNGPQCVSENGTFKLISQSDKNGQKIQDCNSGDKRKRRGGIEPLTFDLSVTGQGYPEFWLLKAEEFYWKNVLNHSPIYAGDLLGTLMDYDKRNEWNIGALDNILTKMDVPVPGVNAPYLYFGMWKASFPWHLEDMDLFSINYIHFGAPKQWYVIPPDQKNLFEAFANRVFASDKQSCPEYLRHKTSMISPSILEENGIKVLRATQKAGDVFFTLNEKIMITFPYAYHQGFNYGFNCAESVNFATESWVDIGKKAHFCTCVEDSVRINVEELENASSKPFNASKWCELLKDIILQYQWGSSGHHMIKRMSKKKPTVELDLTKEKCLLCPLQLGPYMRTKSNKPVHELCAFMVPETYIIDADIDTKSDPQDETKSLEPGLVNPEKSEKSTENLSDQTLNSDESQSKGIVMGIENIPKSRWNLICTICKSRGKEYGACVQCYYGKCIRAFHVTCASNEGVRLFDDEGTPNVLCSLHDPQKIDEKKKAKEEEVISFGSSLVAGDFVRCQWADGRIYEAVVVEQNLETKSCIVDFKTGTTYDVPWFKMERLEEPSNAIMTDDDSGSNVEG